MAKSKKKSRQNNINADELTFAICGEWFPLEGSLLGHPCVKKYESHLDTEMRIYSCMRLAFNKLLEGLSRNELKQVDQVMFNLNSRYVEDAIKSAQAIIDSQRERLPGRIKETEKKLTRTRKKLKQAEKTLAKALAENAEDAIINAKHAVYGHKNRIKRLENLQN